MTEDIENFRFNTAISAMMIFVNKAEKKGLTEKTYEIFLKVLAPFAPHLTEELWEKAGKKTSIHLESFPDVDETLVKDDEITIGVQVNGKIRGSITIAADATEAEAVEIAQREVGVKRHLAKKPDRVVYVSGKILNLITK